MGMFTLKVPEKFLTDKHGATQVREGLQALAIQRGIRCGVLVLFICIAIASYGCPQYNVWQKGLAGKARLAEAEQSRQIAIEEAKARKDSASFDNEAAVIRAEGMASAEVIRAGGVAKANEIIAQGLGGAEGYLRYLWIDAMASHTAEGQIIYVPTEAGMPILEAGKR